MDSQYLQKQKLPDTPGVYMFRRKEKILYIGKATSLRARVKSYFAKALGEARGPLLVDMIQRADGIDFRKTDSVLEALLLEAELITKHQPPFNTKEKDDKSFNCVIITNEEFPRVLIVRKREVDLMLHASRLRRSGFGGQASSLIHAWYGPFPNSSQLKIALKIIRKIFPFRDTCSPCVLPRQSAWSPRVSAGCKPCFNRQIGLCPGVCTGEITQKEYQKTIRHLRLFFEGKRKKLLDALLRDMKAEARAEHFKKAGEIKRTIFALRHIQDVVLLKRMNDSASVQRPLRIEAYDLSHFGGTEIVGAMAVIENETPNLLEYRRFKLRSITQAHETRGLQEILQRRFSHPEWPFPQLIVVDGNEVEERAAKEVLQSLHLSIPIVAVTKDDRHRPKAIFPDTPEMAAKKGAILLANSEAHRFAFRFQKKRRRIAQ